MSEHLTQNQVEEYCQRKLRATDLLAVSDHLGACVSCARRVESALNAEAAFFALRSEVFSEAAELSSPGRVRTHLAVEQTAQFVDGRLAGEELQLVADHLTICEQCALSIDDLRAFKDQVAPTLEREYHPAAVPARSEGWWRRMVASVPSPFLRSPQLAFSGAALALLLLAATSWLIWQRFQESETKQENVVSPAPPVPEAVPVPLVAQLNDGDGQLTLDQEGKLSGADNLPPAYQVMLKEALTNQRIEKSPLLKGLARPPSSLMGGDPQGNKFSVIAPVGKMMLTDRVTFRWSPLNGATGYVIEVYDEKFNPIATSPQLTTTSWTTPQPLGRGRVYSWQVKAIKEGQEFNAPHPPAPQAKFRILDQAKASEISQARRAYSSSRLTLALLYARAGLLEEAEQELRAVEKANPDSAIARKLVANVGALRR